MITPLFYAIKKADGLHFINRSQFDDWIANIPDDSRLQFALGPVFRGWTGNQRRYYWGVLLRDLAETTGYSREWLHNEFIQMFYADHADERTIDDSTTRMSVQEGTQYINDIIHFWWDFAEYHVPLPEDLIHYQHIGFSDLTEQSKQEGNKHETEGG
jgi:hypothetical protein